MQSGRREFLMSAAYGAALAGAVTRAVFDPNARDAAAGNSLDALRAQFPELMRMQEAGYVYLDNAATTLRPQPVIDAIADYYARFNANPGASLHRYARQAAQAYESARADVAQFIHASSPGEIVFTRGTTEAINVAAAGWGPPNLRAGDEILLTVAEHYSNLVPWQLLAKRTGVQLRFAEITDDGHLSLDDFDRLLKRRTRLVVFSHVSNVLGIINPAAEVCRRARAAGARVLVDGAQAAPHIAVDVQALGCDFYAFSSHKLAGPMGIGVLWVKSDVLESMIPYQGGSNMAHNVGLDASMELAHGGHKFEAGTPNVEGPVGLAATIRLLQQYPVAERWKHEQQVTQRLLTRLAGIKGVRVLGSAPADQRISVVSFVKRGIAPEQLAVVLDRAGFAIRAGDLAAGPLLKRLGTDAAARASAYMYNTVEEADRFADALEAVSPV